MKKVALFILYLLITEILFGQIVFEKGYFIDKNGNKIICLIKNIDWKDNPKGFDYKLFEDGEIKSANTEDVLEFSVEGYSKYIRAEVKIDRSPSELSKLSESISPEWSDEIIFLKVLVEGKANLYSYDGRNILRLFYSVDNSPVKQLIYKEYINSDNNISKNCDFRQQLLNNVKLPGQSQNMYNNLIFSKKTIASIFSKYNQYYNPKELNAETPIKKEIRKGDLNLKLVLGINYSDFEVKYAYRNMLTIKDFDKINTCVGMELEYLLPFNKNKWGIIIEPTFQHFKADGQFNFGPQIIWNTTVDCNYLEFPFGIRYNFFLNDQTKIYLTGYFVPDLGTNLNSEIKLNSDQEPLEFIPNNCLALSAGISLYRFSADVRYYFKRNIINDGHWITDFNRLYLKLGYRFY